MLPQSTSEINNLNVGCVTSAKCVTFLSSRCVAMLRQLCTLYSESNSLVVCYDCSNGQISEKKSPRIGLVSI